MKTKRNLIQICFFWLWLLVPLVVRAQLVADGETNVFDGIITNVSAGGIIIGTNGDYTLLIVTNGAVVINGSSIDSIGSVIGLNASARSNRVMVVGAGSRWNNVGAGDPIYIGHNSFYIGQSGSWNELDILNGGVVTNWQGVIGYNSSSSNNLVLVSDPGSAWKNATLIVGNSSSQNTLIVTNGGKVFSGNSGVGENAHGISSNNVIITGPGSSWSSGYFYLGYSGGGHNQMSINNGGTLTTSSTLDIGVYDNSNRLTVADAGSSVQCQTFRIGYPSTANQCIVSNGAMLAVLLSSQPTTIEGTFTTATITGAGSVWTNAGDLDFGQYSNVLSITSGGVMVDNNGYIENGSGKPNTVIVAGTNSLWKNLGDLHIADTGAQLLITNGGTVANNNGYLGDNAGNNNCSVLVAGAGSIWTNISLPFQGLGGALYLGNNGATNQLVVTDSGKVAATGIYVSNNGRLVVANSGVLQAVHNIYNGSSGGLYIGYNGGSPNQMVVSNAAVVNVGGSMQIGNFQGGQNSNTITIYGSTMIVSNGVTIESPGSLVLNSGLFRAGSFSIYNYQIQTNAIVLNGGTLQSGGIAYGLFSYPQPLVVGDGTDMATFQTLNNGTFSGGFIVSSNATLTGVGTVNGNVTIRNGGTITFGTASVSNMVVNGNLTLNDGGTTFMKLNAVNAPGTSPSDSIAGATNLTYGGTLQLTNLSGNLTGAIYSFKLFNASNYSGAFSSLVPATPRAGLRWDTYELNVDGVLRIFPVTSPTPVIGGTAISSTNLIVSANAGIPYDPCYLLTSTNLAAPLSDWTCIATNYYDVTGATGFTNAISPAEPARYFQLQVN